MNNAIVIAIALGFPVSLLAAWAFVSRVKRRWHEFHDDTGWCE